MTLPPRDITASAARMLLILDAATRAGLAPLREGDWVRLAYFTDALAALWGLPAIDRYRSKADEPTSVMVRAGIDRLIGRAIALPVVRRESSGSGDLRAPAFRTHAEHADPVLRAIAETQRGRREMELAEEVVYASASLVNGYLSGAVHVDASYGDARVGPNDLVDLGMEALGNASSEAAQYFERLRSPVSQREAELTHLYMAHLQRFAPND